MPESHPSSWRQALGRAGLYGDIWLRLLSLGARTAPWFIEPLIIAFLSSLFYLLCLPIRRALLANTAAAFPDAGLLERHRRAFLVVWNFAWSLADAAHVRNGHDIIDWEIEGCEHLDLLAATPGGAIILTAHMGNYDLAAPLFASRLKRQLHMVRAPERDHRSQAYASRQRDQLAPDWCVVHYNEPGNMLAIKLATLLKDNQIIAIQGDRILFDVAATTQSFSATHDWRLPKGPFLLGLVARSPIFPIFITRSGWRRYRITAAPPFRWPDGRIDKEPVLQNAAFWWSSLLADTVTRHWEQWFIFEPVFTPTSKPAAP